MRRTLVAVIVPFLLAASVRAEKKIIEGAPICLDAAGKTVPCPKPAAAKREPAPVDGVEGIARLAVQAGAASKPALPTAAPPTAAPPPSPSVPKSSLTPWLAVGLFAALLVLVKSKLAFASGEFEFEPDPRGPGEVARGFLKTRERPDSVKAVLELYEDEKDAPRRSIPAEAGMPEELPEGGWRTPIAVTLPADLYPPFKGGWALSVEAEVGGRRLLAGDNPCLRPPA